jgi:hypothetical protein
MRFPLLITIFAGVMVVSSALAQSAGQGQVVPDQGQVVPEHGVACPPDVKGEPPTVGGGGSFESLSDKLARSKGVICPPAGLDTEMLVTPPGDGRLKVIPPPGAPGGDQNVQPK